jgi:uridylate kinase
MSEPKYKRILLKFSGEALSGNKGYSIDLSVVDYICDEIISAKKLGTEIGVVIGGGNVIRGLRAEEKGVNRVKADYMGMLATIINALAVQDGLEQKGVRVRMMSAIQMIEIAEPIVIDKADEYLKLGDIVIFTAGTGRPFFTTDSGAALRAAELGMDAFIKATKVDGVYDKDPEKYSDAKLYIKLDYQAALEKQLRVMDLTAFTLCKDNRIPIIVYNMKKKGNLQRILRGEQIGTLIYEEKDD